MCYFYQRDMEGIRRQDFSRFVPPLCLYSRVLLIIMNGFFVRINMLAIYHQGMEEFISCGIYQSHSLDLCVHTLTFLHCVFSNFLSNNSHFTAHGWVHMDASSFVTAICLFNKDPAVNVHRMTVFFCMYVTLRFLWWGFLASQARTLGYCYGSQRNTV